MRSRWALDPDVTPLNHGSFGATPRAVLAAQERIRDRLEANPTGFFEDHYQGELDEARTTLATFLGADPAGLALVTNATAGVASAVVAEHLREQVRPTVVSHGWNTVRDARSLFHRLFDWTGTFDPSGWLAVPDALAFMATLDPDGWEGVMTANRALALGARDLLTERLGIEPPVPDSMIGSMAALPLADARPGLAERLRRQGIVVAVPPWPTPGGFLLRISAQRYNTLDEYERLADGINAG